MMMMMMMIIMIIMQALAARRLEISSLVSAHIIWDNEEAGIVILG